MNREKISTRMGLTSIITTFSEGNPGALRVLLQLLESPADLVLVLSLDDMNIRGSQIWIGYKDHCGEDMDAFREAIRSRDAKMVETINANSGSAEIAVTSGASFER